MKTKEKFQEIIAILGLYYKVSDITEIQAVVSPPDEIKYKKYQVPEERKSVLLDLVDDSIVLSLGQDDRQIINLDEANVGASVLQIEWIVIDYTQAQCKPLALSIYLYYRLLGTLWGLKAGQQLKDKDPTPGLNALVILRGTRDGVTYVYHYGLNIKGQIFVEKRSTQRFAVEYYAFTPLDYTRDPEGTLVKFLEFFNDINEIESAGRG